MDRLLLLRLQSKGCAAEARLNDFCIARTAPTGGCKVLPVHEYVLEGENRLELQLDPIVSGVEPAPRRAATAQSASVRLLLPRVGRIGSEHTARALAELDIEVPPGDIYVPPLQQSRQVVLPIRFPRWRWCDLPVIESLPAAQPRVAAFVQELAIAMAKGDADAFLRAARLRFEELALAYQQPVAELASRWRSRLQLLQGTQALAMVLPALADVMLKPCAGGRLAECVTPTGEPVLRTDAASDGSRQVWPVRVAVVEGHCHVVR